MAATWQISLDTQERRPKVSMLEGRAHLVADAREEDEVAFTLTLYTDQVSLNVPATSRGREFIACLTDIFGPPRLEPTIKCSCTWSPGVMGAMLIVLWDLHPEAKTQQLQDLEAFLGTG